MRGRGRGRRQRQRQRQHTHRVHSSVELARRQRAAADLIKGDEQLPRVPVLVHAVHNGQFNLRAASKRWRGGR